MAEGGDRGRATGLGLSVDSTGWGHYPEVPHIQVSTVGGERTESELTQWAHMPGPNLVPDQSEAWGLGRGGRRPFREGRRQERMGPALSPGHH